LLTSRISNLTARICIWTIAALIPVYVAFSRMYRGMHHPLDIGGGVLIGIRRCLRWCSSAGRARRLTEAPRHDEGRGHRARRESRSAAGCRSSANELERQGVVDPLWVEVREEPVRTEAGQRVLEEGAS
jgi:hypothetical protein